MSSRNIIPPQPNPETAAYWQAANQGKLMLKRCCDTGTAFYYPRDHSPFTGGATEWFEASGQATLYSYSILLRSPAPYCLAYVHLAEGPLMMSNILTEDFNSLSIGQALRLDFLDSGNGQQLPVFRPA